MSRSVTQSTNAPRKRPKWRKGVITDEYREWSADLTVCYDLVEVARGALNRFDLYLKTGGPKSTPPILRAGTDGTTIFLPKNHPRRRLVTKHELAHIYFDSDIPLRMLFAKSLILELQKESGTIFTHTIREKLIDDICFLVNIFDDLRVNSLWGLLYEGDGYEMDHWYCKVVGPRMRDRATKQFGHDIPHMFTYIILISIGMEVESSRWGIFKEDIQQAAADVHYKSFTAVLLITKRLIYRIAKQLYQERPNGKEPAWGKKKNLCVDKSTDALLKSRKSKLGLKNDEANFTEMLAEMGRKYGSAAVMSDDNAGFNFNKRKFSNQDMRRSATLLTALKGIDIHEDADLSSFLHDQEESTLAKVQEIQKRTAKIVRRENNDDFLKSGIQAEIKIQRVKRKDVVPTFLTPQEIEIARRWKHQFVQIEGRRASDLVVRGEEFAPDAYIQQRINREPLRCFYQDTSKRGFRLILLIDMSGSMGRHFKQVERLTATLQTALQFPFVTVEIMGFNSKSHGTVDMTIYPKDTPGLRSKSNQPAGVTPLPHAIQFAGKSLRGSEDETHMFIISDGMPVYYLKNKTKVDESSLIDWTRSAVVELKSRDIRCWCFTIGNTVPAESMDTMFSPRSWKRVGGDSIYEESFKFIREHFMRFISQR